MYDAENLASRYGRPMHGLGEVFARIETHFNVVYGVQTADRCYFVKPTPDPDVLGNAVRMAAAIEHPAVPPLRRVIETAEAPARVYDWVDGEALGRRDPGHERFCALPVREICAGLSVVFDVHRAAVEAGWVAVDFYDSSLIYDFAAAQMWVIDLDLYRDRPFRNEMARMYGSSRFMAPEEFELGALIDERTTVFTMGRTIQVFLGERATAEIAAVAGRACDPERARRWGSVREFADAWESAAQLPQPQEPPQQPPRAGASG